MGRKRRGTGKKKRGGPPASKASAPAPQQSLDFPEFDTNTPLVFGIGTRVACPHLAELEGGKLPSTGTVVGHWVRLESSPEGRVVPYKVLLDDGTAIVNGEDFLQRLDEPPMKVVFKIGSRVECKLGESDEYFPERPFWGPPDCIRESTVTGPRKKKQTPCELRFKVGDRVDCSIDELTALPGTVIKTWYVEEDNFDNGYAVPYQIQLDSGQYIYAPIDDDQCIKRSTVPPPSCWICFDNEQTETNLILRECACRGEHNGFVHVDCLVKLALSKVDLDKEPELPIPFSQCITCQQTFAPGSHCLRALARAFSLITADCDIGNTWNKMATTMMCELFIHEMQDRITKIRSKIEEGDQDVRWMKDLKNFLIDLADVYEATDSLDEMKEVLDESLALAALLGRDDMKIAPLASLAKHAYHSGDKIVALQHAEEAVALAREQKEVDTTRLAMLLLYAGDLNVELNNRERGLAQISEAVKIRTRVYGHDHMEVRQARGLLEHHEAREA